MHRPRVSLIKFSSCLLVLVGLAVPGLAQLPVITGIGLSADRAVLDSTAAGGDTLSIVISFDRPAGMNVVGLGLSADQLDAMMVHYYDVEEPQGSILSSFVYPVPSAAVEIDTVSVPNLIRFNLVLRGDIDDRAVSLQIEMRLYGYLNNQLQFSDSRTSHASIGGIPPAGNPVDGQHSTYLRYQDTLTLPPDVLLPVSGSTLTRNSPLHFRLPENARPGTLIVTFTPAGGTEPVRQVYLRNTVATPLRELILDAGALDASSEVDSVIGPVSLTPGNTYTLTLSYRDMVLNPAARDSAVGLGVDLLTAAPALIEPRAGSVNTEPQIRVIYDLPEVADTVQLIFTVDSLSPVPDVRSPHVLTLEPGLYGPGLVSFYLDGNNIGTGDPNVLYNPNGPDDALEYGAVYSVTLSYGDLPGNPPATVTNPGFNWPSDLYTSPPLLIDPRGGIRENASFWVQFHLPEPPLPGSVRLFFRRSLGSGDPGSPHVLCLGNLVSAGTFGVMLDATWFSSSDLVTCVEGPGTWEQNNMLVHNARYRVGILYQDTLGNPVAGDSVISPFVTYDIVTDPASAFAPVAGDTLSLGGTDVVFFLQERARPGTLKLVLTQTGGPDQDFLSPHVLFVNDSLGQLFYQLSIQPGDLGSSTGLDSVSGPGGGLVARGIYRLSIEYQDTLNNAAASTVIEDLHMPSGASVFVQGHGFGVRQVIPNEARMLVFQLSLRTFQGTSLLRGLRFHNDGTIVSSDVDPAQSFLWSSVDSIFNPDQDVQVATMSTWTTGDLRFSNIGVPIQEMETYVFATLGFRPQGDPIHRVNLMLLGPESIDCGGDPVLAMEWPLGERDVPLSAQVMSFAAVQDTAFGSLRLQWIVASEINNEGFNVLRRTENDTLFQTIASFTSTPSLAGRGTASTAWTYSFTDHGLAAGRTYVYRLQAVSSENLYAQTLDIEASGSPRLPPSDFILSDAFPNPFNQDVTIRYVVPFSAEVEIDIYDISGRLVRALVRNLLPPSDYVAQWNARDDNGIAVPSGIYFYRLRADGGRFEQTKRLMLIR